MHEPVSGMKKNSESQLTSSLVGFRVLVPEAVLSIRITGQLKQVDLRPSY